MTSTLAVQKLEDDLKKLEPKVSQLQCSTSIEAKEETIKLEESRDILIETGKWSESKEEEFNLRHKLLTVEEETLKKWEYKYNLHRSLKEEIFEDQQFLKDTEDVITRLKIRQNFLIN